MAANRDRPLRSHASRPHPPRWFSPSAALLVLLLAMAALVVWPGQQPASVAELTSADALSAREAARQIDRLILEHAEQAELKPAPMADDAAFLRRVSVDLIGRIPTVEEYRAYMSLPEDTRRDSTIRRLIAHDRFARRWVVMFANALQIRHRDSGGRQVYRFIRKSLHESRPYDQMIRELVTATGTVHENPAAGLFTSRDADPMQMAATVSHGVLGIRMKCAQCHNHPYDDWTQKDFYHLAAYFGQTKIHRYRNEDDLAGRVFESKENTVMWPPSPSNEQPQPLAAEWPVYIAEDQKIAAKPPRLEAPEPDTDDMLASMLGEGGGDDLGLGQTLESSQSEFEAKAARQANRVAERREKLAGRLTDPSNPYFSWNVVNRVWGVLFGRGIVHPVDDFKWDNLPSHPELLNFLAETFVASGYDFKFLVYAIVSSDAYQRGTLQQLSPSERQPRERAFLAQPLRRMPAEAMYDSLVTAGHLWKHKHPPGHNIKKREVTIRIEPSEEETLRELMASMDQAMVQAGADQDEMERMKRLREQAAMQPDDPYSAETDVAIEQILTMDAGPLADASAGVVEEDPAKTIARNKLLEELREQAQALQNLRAKYKTVVETYDDNPRFSSAYTMPSPAPPEHFLRQFGQSSRQTLGEHHNTKPSTRQALILLNGKLANEAARVGRLEPMWGLLQRPDSLPRAVQRAYVSVLSRQPTEAEQQNAIAFIQQAPNREAGMADLRWALLNSHEFRFLP